MQWSTANFYSEEGLPRSSSSISTQPRGTLIIDQIIYLDTRKRTASRWEVCRVVSPDSFLEATYTHGK